MISQPVSSILPCSPLPSGTWRTPGLFIFWCCLPTSSSAAVPSAKKIWSVYQHNAAVSRVEICTMYHDVAALAYRALNLHSMTLQLHTKYRKLHCMIMTWQLYHVLNLHFNDLAIIHGIKTCILVYIMTSQLSQVLNLHSMTVQPYQKIKSSL